MTSSSYDFLRSLILPIKQIDNYLPKRGLIIDLGCGQGLIAKHLAKCRERSVIGVDANARRLPTSNLRNLKFIASDITKYKIEKASGIVISDVLHHINLEKQKNILRCIYKSLKPGGALIIKEIDSGEFIRSSLSRLWDFIIYPKDKISYWNASVLKQFLRNLGFSVKLERTSRLFPGSTTLLICKKS